MKKSYVSDKVNDIPRSGIRAFSAIAKDYENVLSLSIGEPDFNTPYKIKEAAIKAMIDGKTHYAPSGGIPALKKEISAYLKRRFDVEYDENDILLTVGASMALDLAFRTILNPGDEVIILEPSYVAYTPDVKLSDGTVRYIHLKAEEDFKLTPDALKEAINDKTKAVLLNYPSNPTGGIMTKEDYEKLIPVIKESGIVVIADEIYAELTYGRKHDSIACFDEIKDQLIYISGFSKAFAMTGWRLGYVCAPKEILDAMIRIMEFTVMSPTAFVQYGAVEAMKSCDEDVEEMRDDLEQRRNYTVNRLNQMGLTCKMPEGAFYAFPSIKSTGLTSMEFSTRLVREYQVITVPGSSFGESGEGHIRISYASSMAVLKEALNRIEKMIKEIKK